MKNSITLLFLLVSCVTNAQFSIQPQIGLENSRTTIQSNEFTCFAPMGVEFAPRLALRMNYKSKSGHGAFFGLATSSQAVELKFTDPQAVKTTYTASGKELQLGLEGGYQFSTKPISLGKAVSANRSVQKYGEGEKRNCVTKASCGQKSTTSHCNKTFDKITTTNKGLFMRIIPNIGIAFKPSGASEIETETKGGQTTYEYKASTNTAFIAGTALEFGSRDQSRFVVSINYLKSLGNSEETINTIANGKTVATSFRSKASSFNISLGLPINLAKNKSASQKKQCQRSNQSRCGQYRIYNQ